MSDRPWLTQKEICERFDISIETWRRWVISGRAPARDPESPKRRPTWGKQTIQDWDDRRRGLEKPVGRTFFNTHRRSA